MPPESPPILETAAIRAARGPRAPQNPNRPVTQLLEWELSAANQREAIATLFLTNRECAFTCVMCDLWKNTLTERVPVGAIPQQIDVAFAALGAQPGETPPWRHVKLYNSANFFDHRAIPREDFPAIAERVQHLETVIVESHPEFLGVRDDHCLRFRDLLQGTLEVAIGLETVNPEILRRLNKQMTVADFDRAVAYLTTQRVAARAFILLAPPFLEPASAEADCRTAAAPVQPACTPSETAIQPPRISRGDRAALPAPQPRGSLVPDLIEG